MAEEEKIYRPETIDDTPFPQEGEENLAVTQKTSNEIFHQEKIRDQNFPTRKIAADLIGPALNTKSKKILAEFEFTESGAIKIGDFVQDVSGDIRITPNGIVARNATGAITFSLDGTTGDAVFKGTIQAESFIGGSVYVGGNNIILDGENRRILISDGTTDRILIGFDEGGF